MKEQIVIIDGNSLINRAYYAIQRPMITRDGMYTQGIYGFLRMLSKIRADYEPTHMLVAFDRKGPTFRHDEYSEYKAGRRKMPPELAMEIPVLKEILDAMGISRFEMDGFEADDIIGTTCAMSEEAGISAFVITGDRDALQLATDKTSVIITKKGISEFMLYDDAAMMEEYGFDHEQFIDYKALRGDPSDNIPGVPGVGEKTAIKMIQQFGSIENIIANIEQVESARIRSAIEENITSLLMSKRLATIVRSVPVDYGLEDCRLKPENLPELIELYSKLEFNSFLKELSRRPAEATARSAADSSADEQIALPLFEAESKPVSDGQMWISLKGGDSHVDKPSPAAFFYVDESGFHAHSDGDVSGELLSLLSGKTLKLCGFDLGRLYYLLCSMGADVSGLETAFDCAIAEYVISPSGRSKELAAILLERYHVQAPVQEAQQDMFSLCAGISEGEISREKEQLELMRRLAEDQTAEIESFGLSKVYYDIELPLCKVLASMEAEGISVDRTFLKDFGEDLKQGILALESEIHGLAGEVFNINSPQQLGGILFEKLGLPASKKTKTGYSTSAEVLSKLSGFHPIIEKILEYRTLSKLNSTYVEGLLPLINPDGKIRAHFQQMVTATGRISCTEPNLQNIPVRQEYGRQLRRAFSAESEDYCLVGADYSQIELRVLAHMSEDPTLIKAFNDGLDIHRETAAKIFGVPQSEVSPQMRSDAKAVNFGVIYGMSGFGLASELTISRRQAERYIEDYFQRFQHVRRFMDEAVAECRRTGVSRTLFGRRREIPEIRAAQFMVRQLGERLAMNTPIQGSAADIIKLAMIKVYEALQRECPKSKLILQVHDELIIQAHKSEKDRVKEILRECMQSAAELKVKLDVSMEEGDNWYELK